VSTAVSPPHPGSSPRRHRVLADAVAAELLKIATARFTWWTVGSSAAISLGMAYLVGHLLGAGFEALPAEQRDHWDPLFAAFYPLTLGQLPLVVLAVVATGSEYSAGMIRISLAAVPRRGLFLAGKAVATAVTVLVAAVVIVPVMVLVSQQALGTHGTRLTAAAPGLAMLGACAYLTLIGLFAVGVTGIIRSSVAALGALLPVMFLGSQGLANVPRLEPFLQYLPDQLGAVVMHLADPDPSSSFGRDYGPWTGLGLLGCWAAAALLGFAVASRSRDS
jgi:ABC-2 type transport system permease protein